MGNYQIILMNNYGGLSRWRPVGFRALAMATICAAGLTAASGSAWAHSFGVRYDLPVPLWLYLVGAGAGVAASFALLAVFLKQRGAGVEQFRYDLLRLPLLGWLGGGLALTLIRLLSLALFILLLAAGLFGNPDPFKNIAPTFVWVVWWVGMAFISSLVGNFWDLVNPWKIIFTWARALAAPAGSRPYPAWLGHWPAVVMFTIFAWLELISEQGEQPRTLAALIITYSAITWAGMAYFGRDKWLQQGEIFTVAFGLLARFAPTSGEAGEWRLRAPAAGLLSRQPVPFSNICFVLLLLTTVTFDGLLETPWWATILAWIAESHALRPALLALQNAGADLIVVIESVALLLLPLIFLAVFLLTCKAIAWAGGGARGSREIAGYFVLSLIPIAIAYHLSHYLSYLLIAGQNVIPLASDPFGLGWDLFGTAAYAVDLGIVNARMIWYVAVSAIVAGHVLAVYVAHVMAARLFESPALALKSQLPMLILMVGYTMTGLWILSQPIVA